MNKICVVCGKEYKAKIKNQNVCSKECRKEACRIRANKHYLKNKDYKKSYQKEYNKKIKDKKEKIIKQCLICGNNFVYSAKNRKYCSIECRNKADTIKKENWAKQNKDKCKQIINKHRKKKYYINTNFRLSVFCRKNIKRCISSKKEYKTFDILDYTPQQLKQRLEFQFKNGMNWDNYGTYWVVHHKKELHKFNFGDKDNINYEQIRIANSLANLQPITIEEHKLIHSKQKG